MRIHPFLYALTAALALSACSQDEAQQQLTPKPIRLVSTLDQTPATRAFTALNIPNNTRVYVWADMINLSDSRRINYFNTWALTAKGDGTLESASTPVEVKFFPATNKLDLYAMSGSFSGFVFDTANELPTTRGLYHTVRSDQTAESSYYASDLLYSQVRGQVPVETAVQLPFYHMLSKVRVVLIPGTGDTTADKYGTVQLRNATVTLLNLETRAKLTPKKEAYTNAQFALQDNRATMIEVAPKTDEDDTDAVFKRDITMQTISATPNDEGNIATTSYGEAIIVPQEVPADKFIKVTLTDPGTGLTHDTFYRFASKFTFESGKQYQFQLTLDRIGDTYAIAPEIKDWAPEKNDSGDPVIRSSDFTGTIKGIY